MIASKIEKATGNSKLEEQLNRYMTFEMVSDVDPENIPIMNSMLESINYMNEKEGETLISYLPLYIYTDWVKAQEIKNKAKQPRKNKEKSTAQVRETKECSTIEIEPAYAQYIYTNDSFASIARDEECFMHEWIGNYWKKLNKLGGQKLALGWIEKNHPDKATAKNASSCYDTARIGLLNKRQFPEKRDDEIFIPLKNKWLMINDQGTIHIVEPSKDVGITHQINATLVMTPNIATDDFGNLITLKLSKYCGIDDFGNQINIEYQPKPLPDKSLFKTFLDTSIPNKMTQDILQEYVGYTLLPDTRYQKALVCVGKGSNGKGIFFDVVSNLHENVASVVLEKLGDFGLSQIPDASLVCVAETPKKGINEEMLKQLISGDRVVIEIKKKNQFTYKPFAKWLISCNSFPRIQDETDGVWRRLIIVNWEKQFLDSDKINNLDKKIIATEMGLVLDWALIGLKRLLSRGENGDFIISDHIKYIKSQEKEKSNNVIPFIENTYLEKCTTATTKKDDIFKKYQAHCINRGVMPYGDVEFWKRVGYYYQDGLIVERKRDGGERKFFINLSFNQNMNDDESDNPFEKK